MGDWVISAGQCYGCNLLSFPASSQQSNNCTCVHQFNKCLPPREHSLNKGETVWVRVRHETGFNRNCRSTLSHYFLWVSCSPHDRSEGATPSHTSVRNRKRAVAKILILFSIIPQRAICLCR